MNHQAPRVADVGEMREDLEAVDELARGFKAALDAEAEDRAAPFGRYFCASA